MTACHFLSSSCVGFLAANSCLKSYKNFDDSDGKDCVPHSLNISINFLHTQKGILEYLIEILVNYHIVIM